MCDDTVADVDPFEATVAKGGFQSYGYYYLQVDEFDAAGTFRTTTWTATPV